MAIPNMQTLMLPLLEAVADGVEHRIRDVTAKLADVYSLSAEERQQRIPSGQQGVFTNRVAWAQVYLKKAALLEAPKRGVLRITDQGREVLQERPDRIDLKFLKRFPSYVAFREHCGSRATPAAEVRENDVGPSETPEEAIEVAYRDLQERLAGELLERLRNCSPAFFEQLVVELLVAMGYGGSLADAGKAIGRTGDGGIDGIIKEDKLGLDVVCLQAKRWKGTVGRPEVQAFAGSMEGFRARKGVLLTTASFSKDATEYISRIERKIVLIDGEQLAELMIEHGIGVTTTRTYALKKIDSDYFVEDGIPLIDDEA